MAKDDYDLIVYRVLVYLYACLKGKYCYDENAFRLTVKKDISSEEYFTRVLNMMQTEGLITGITVTKAWGNIYLLVSDLCCAEITADGIRYLKDNSTMNRAGRVLWEAADAIASLAALLGL